MGRSLIGAAAIPIIKRLNRLPCYVLVSSLLPESTESHLFFAAQDRHADGVSAWCLSIMA